MTLYAPSVETFYIGDFFVEKNQRNWIASMSKTFCNHPINDLHIITLYKQDEKVAGRYSPPLAGRNDKFPTPNESPTIKMFDIIFVMVDGKDRTWRYELEGERDNDYNKFMSYGRQLPKLDDVVPLDVPEPAGTID